MSKFIPLVQAAKILNESRQNFFVRLKKEPVPLFFKKKGRLYLIDIDHPDFKSLEQEMKLKYDEKNKMDIEDIRLKVYSSRKYPAKIRHVIFERDNYTCKICGTHKDDLKNGVNIEVDHILSWKDGGLTTYDNGQTVCSTCNKGKYHSENINNTDYYEGKIEALRMKSLMAKFELPIQASELNAYKIQQERIKLEKESKNLIEYDLANFLFIGYLERINRESLNFPKRITKDIDLIIQDGIHAKHDSHIICKKIIKIVSREIEAILKDVIKEQKKDVIEWKSDN